MSDIAEFQNIINIQFYQPELLIQALTHRSYINEQIEIDVEDNERLEYLGDAILDFITGDMLYRRFPSMSEGELTRLRAALVRTESLALLARACRLGEFIIMGKGEAASGGRDRDNILCGTFEAVVGAIYLDRGLDLVKNFVIPRLTELQKDVMDEAIRKDPRSRFQEIIQAAYNITPRYRLISTDGPEHEKVFTVEVHIGDYVVTTGKGKNKRVAAQAAARNAMTMFHRGEVLVPVKEPEPNTPEVNETDETP